MFFFLLDAVDVLWLFLEWLQFVIGVVLVMLLFLILMGLVVGFLDLILDPVSVFLGVIGKTKKKRRKRRRPTGTRTKSFRSGPKSRSKPQAKRNVSERVPSGAPVEEGGSFVMPYEMKRYLDEYLYDQRSDYGPS